MELGLSLGDSPPALGLADAARDLGLSLRLGSAKTRHTIRDSHRDTEIHQAQIAQHSTTTTTTMAGEPPVHLSLLPLNFSWPPATQNTSKRGGFDVNRAPSAEELEEGAALSSSPNSAVSSFQMDFSARRGTAATTSGGGGSEGNGDPERKGADGSHSRASDEDETGSSRKKLRLSKEQSAFLEESFKEHNTLNPKQKLALAKQLNLRPRQVEVWFQNRRARTKLKQTEVDCEYLKRCCETLTEENRRLQKELAELRALKTAHPFYMHLPATTLSMCPSCERVASSSTSSSSVVAAASNTASTSAAAAAATSSDHRPNSFAALFNRPRGGFPFSGPPQQPPASS